MRIFPGKAKKIILGLILCVFMAGCGNVPQPSLDDKVIQEEEEIYFGLVQQWVPDPADALTDEIWQDSEWKLVEEDSLFWEDSWYLFSHFYLSGRGTVAACVQVLAPPYDQWVSYGISDEWLRENSYGRSVEKFAGVTEEGLLLEVLSLENEGHLLELYKWDGTMEFLMDVPERLNGSFWHWSQDEIMASGGSRNMAVFDQEGQEKYSHSLTGIVAGILEEPGTENLFSYGFERDELVLWNKSDGEVTSRINNQINPYDDFGIAFAPTGEILVANTDYAWLYSGETKESQELISFMECEYPLDVLYGCCFGEEDMPLFFVEFDGEKYVLTAEPRDSAQEKQEISLMLMYSWVGLQKLAASYNRQSQEYHVTIITPEDSEDWDDYRMRAQLEMSAGRGPDLLEESVIYGRESAAMEYLEPLDWIIEDESPFLEAALMAGQSDGKTYGIPYSCIPYCLTVSRQITDRSSWTLAEMMEDIRNSPAKVLQYGCDGVGIVMYYGLYDEENTAFIDWEKGESHLTEQPFLDLMAFAKEYGDNGGYEGQDFMKLLQDGDIAGTQIMFQEPSRLNLARNCFAGEEAILGYPRQSGNGIYLFTNLLYMNKNATSKEGAADFLRYIISEEGQRKLMDYSAWDLSVRRTANEYRLKTYQQSVMNPPVQRNTSEGYYWEETALDEEQIAKFWWLLDNAVPDNFQAADLWSIVEEELQPYFNGNSSAEQAASTLSSRVQIYLDERK